MKHFTLLLIPLLISINLYAQNNRFENSFDVQFITEDVSRFWMAFDEIEEKGENTFDDYVQNGTLGLKGFMPWVQNSKALYKKVNSIPNDYLLSRNVLDELTSDKNQKRIQAIYNSMKSLKQDARFPPIYFVVGRFTSGGTANSDGIIIGTELYSDKTPLPKLSKEADNTLDPTDKIPTIIAHELVHYQQNIEGEETLLKQCIIEGSADFIGELISGKNMNPNAFAYGNKHKDKLYKEFITRMDKNDYTDWLYEISGKDDRPYDLGYWIGYKITKAYYDKQTDKYLAIQNILNIKSPKEFLSESGLLNKYQITIPFINKTPIIDGQLDVYLSSIKKNEFNFIWQFDNPVTDTVKVTYRMAYTPTHLYVYIEAEADSISYHRRGYLWGDGYKVLLGIPQKDSLTNEYYELSYSPSKDLDYWDRQRIGIYNFSQVQKNLGKSSISQEMAKNGKSGFEALISWSDIEPYHPWFMDKMGYNIYFAKGIESKEYGYFTNGYSVVEDEGIWDEEIAKRNYNIISFEKPPSVSKEVILVKPSKKNLKIKEKLELIVVTIGNQSSIENLNVTFSDLESNIILTKRLDFKTENTLRKEKYTIDLGELIAGKYKLDVHNSNDTIISTDIVILPTIAFKKINQKLHSNKHQLQLGVVNTLQFELNQIENKLKALKVYETGEDILEDWSTFKSKYNSFLKGVDSYKNITKPYRRAFKSKYDGTYQPYTIKLPKNYNKNKKYPLLVFLHGSGRDEQGLLNSPRSGGNFIEIAPLARDIYRAYASDGSQKDIVEAIEDAIKYFPVDKNNIVIGGFSMGGYGALRTFYEHPDLYNGVAVFAGHPNLASEWLDEEHPNFLEGKYLTPFSNIPVFIYHGKKDAGLDVNLIEQMSEKLIKVGAKVTIRIVEDKGHEYPDKETNSLYFKWLNKITHK